MSAAELEGPDLTHRSFKHRVNVATLSVRRVRTAVAGDRMTAREGALMADEMRVTIKEVDLAACRALAFDQSTSQWVIVLPGAGYSVQAPLLWYARSAALAGGRSALVITDVFERERDEPSRWVRERTEAAFAWVRERDPNPLLITKSLTSLAAPLAAREHLPGIWFTPVLRAGTSGLATDVIAGLRAASDPQLIVGGTADETWDGAVARSVPMAEVVELPEANHSLEVPNDLDRSLLNLDTATRAVAGFIGSLNQRWDAGP